MAMCDRVVAVLLFSLGVVVLEPTAVLAQAETADREKAASEAAATFLNELGAAMKREMAKGGPTEAIKEPRCAPDDVCHGGWSSASDHSRLVGSALGGRRSARVAS